MDAQQKWRQRGGSVQRPGGTTAPRNISRSSASTAGPRAPSTESMWTSKQTAEQGGNSRNSTGVESERAPSRWKEMRQSVRTRATNETIESRPVNARIADLCPEDREKVAKLVRRIVEVGTLHEEGEKNFQRQREVLEAEVKELRKQVQHDVEELQEQSKGLQSARRRAQLFEERVLVLEESTDAETRARLEAEQTLDLLKLEVDKLRQLVQRQQDEMQRKIKVQQDQFDTDLEQVKDDLKEAQELLLKERNERIFEKQKALDQRLEHSVMVSEEKLDRLHSLLAQQQDEMQRKLKEQQDEMLLKAREQQERYDAEVDRLKQELKTSQNMLQQARHSHGVKKERIAAAAVSHEEDVLPADQTAEQAAIPVTDQQSNVLAAGIQDDLAIFEEVKDLYAEDLFASRRWGTGCEATAYRPADQYSSAWLQDRQEALHLLEPLNTSLSSVLPVDDSSIQEAIERDMETLLRNNKMK